jgi:hypothetical protein
MEERNIESVGMLFSLVFPFLASPTHWLVCWSCSYASLTNLKSSAPSSWAWLAAACVALIRVLKVCVRTP